MESNAANRPLSPLVRGRMDRFRRARLLGWSNAMAPGGTVGYGFRQMTALRHRQPELDPMIPPKIAGRGFKDRHAR
jgi:hypothetical protein